LTRRKTTTNVWRWCSRRPTSGWSSSLCHCARRRRENGRGEC
jgi:hypothetical protein